jgi:ComF family protein
MPDGRTCQTCRRSSRLYSALARTYYDGLAKDLVWQLKFERAQAATKEMALLMKPLLPTEGKNLLITHAPTATSRVRQRGYDQAQLIAKELARLSGLPYAACLLRLGQHRQVGSSRVARKAHLAEAFQAKNLNRLRDAHVILIDDVLTTGATLEAAAATLKAAGAARVEAVVFARP